VTAVVVRTKKSYGARDGTYIAFDENAAVLIDAQNNPRGTRIWSGGPRAAGERNFMKIVPWPEVSEHANAARIKTDDEVIVDRWKDRGKRGQGAACRPEEGPVVYVEGLNIVKHHGTARVAGAQRASSRRRDREGGPIICQTCMLLDPKDGKADPDRIRGPGR